MLLALSAVASSAGDFERAACLFGASATLRGEWSATYLDTMVDVDASRVELGEPAFAVAFDRGARMSLAEAIAYGLTDEVG
jgi:hypothetical protein